MAQSIAHVADHRRQEVQPNAPAASDSSLAPRTAALTAGIGILLIAVLAAFGNFVAVEGLVTPGDAATTADDIAAAKGAFRLGVLSLYLVIVLDVLVAWALLWVFTPVSRSLSMLAAWFRLAYSAVFLVAISQLAGIPDQLAGRGSGAFTAQQTEAQVMLKVQAYHDIWFAGLVLFGAHLALLGWLAYRSGYVPRVLGALLVIAGLGYAFDTAGRVLTESPPQISIVTFVGELSLALWLVVRSRRIGAEHHAV